MVRVARSTLPEQRETVASNEASSEPTVTRTAAPAWTSGTEDSGTGKVRRSFLSSASSTIGCVVEEVPAWMSAPRSARRRVMTPANGAVIVV